jgi:hypothetical protein
VQPGQLEQAFVETLETAGPYEYAVLVTDLAGEILTLAQHYRDRADCENVFDDVSDKNRPLEPATCQKEPSVSQGNSSVVIPCGYE